MTLDAEFAQYQGQSVLVPGAAEAERGQCVQWADYVLYDVYGLPYVWANAIDFWQKFGSISQLNTHFDQITDGSIKKGDFVIFNEKVGSIYGHIDVAMQDGTTDNFTGADSNWTGNKTVHLVNHVGRQYVLGSLRLKGGADMSVVKPWREGIVVAYQNFENKNPTEAQIAAQMSQPDIRNVYESLMQETNALIKDLKSKAATDATVLAPGKYIVE